MKPITAAAIQFQHHAGDKSFNLNRVVELSQQAKRRGVQLACFPEMCLTGYWHVRKLDRDDVLKLAEPIEGGPLTDALRRLASRQEMTIGAGLIERSDDDRIFNSYVVAMPDGNIAVHRKLHCFINEHFSSGDEFTVFDIPQGARVGVLICYDNNLGENVRINAMKGAEILLAPHQTGGCATPSPRCMGAIAPQLWHQRQSNPEAIEAEFRGPKGRQWLLKWLPARAHDNGLFVIFSNGVGLDDDEVRTGNSMILDAYGDILAETWKADDEIVVAKLDPSMQPSSTGRRWLKSRRPELYRPLCERTGDEQDIRSVRFNPVQ